MDNFKIETYHEIVRLSDEPMFVTTLPEIVQKRYLGKFYNIIAHSLDPDINTMGTKHPN